MATLYWLGNAAAVAQFSSVAIGAYDASTAYAITINGKSVSILGTGGTAAATATALAAACEASTIPEFVEIAWTSTSDAVGGTSSTPGVPFTFTAAVSGGTGTVSSVSTGTSPTGPNDWGNNANWSTGTIPANGDTVYIQNSTVGILYGLGQSGVTLEALNIAASFTGNIGLAQYTGKYQQYRPTFLAIGASLLNVGYGSGSGSPLVRIDTGSVATSISVSQTGASSETGLPAFCWRGSSGENAIEILRGNVGIAAIPGDSGAVGFLNIGYVTSQLGDAQVYCGPGSSLGVVKASGGATSIYGTLGTSTNILLNGGSVTVYGSTAMGEFTINAGTLYWNSTGIIGASGGYAHSIGATGSLDLSQDMNGKTFYAGTTITCVKGATINDPNNVMLAASGKITVQPSGCSIDGLNLDFGIGRAISV